MLTFAFAVAVLLVPPAYAIDEYDGRKSSVVGAGDTNADGVPDVAANTGHIKQHVRIFSGVDGAQLLMLSPPEPRMFARALASGGDLNGDGHDDLLVGYGEKLGIVGREYGVGRISSWTNGMVVAFSGQDGGILHRLRSRSEPADSFGFSVAGNGDVNLDGVPDIVVGAPGADQGVGRADVFSGIDGGLLWSVNGRDVDASRLAEAVEGNLGIEGLGGAVALGPPNGVGRRDVLVGGHLREEQRYSNATRMGIVLAALGPPDPPRALVANPFVAHGSGGGVCPWEIRVWDNGDVDRRLVLVTSINEWWSLASWPTWQRKTGEDAIGGNIASDFSSSDFIGDVNADGIADFVTGDFETYFPMWDRGRWAVYCGASGTALHESVDQEDGFEVCGPGDLNRDGIGDVALMMPLSGIVRAVSGAGWETIWEVDLNGLDRPKKEE